MHATGVPCMYGNAAKLNLRESCRFEPNVNLKFPHKMFQTLTAALFGVRNDATFHASGYEGPRHSGMHVNAT